jgi:hypothetical protein
MNNAWLVAKLLTSAHEKRPKFALYTSNSLLPGTRMQPLLPNLYVVTFEVEMFLRVISSIPLDSVRQGIGMVWRRGGQGTPTIRRSIQDTLGASLTHSPVIDNVKGKQILTVDVNSVELPLEPDHVWLPPAPIMCAHWPCSRPRSVQCNCTEIPNSNYCGDESIPLAWLQISLERPCCTSTCLAYQDLGQYRRQLPQALHSGCTKAPLEAAWWP